MLFCDMPGNAKFSLIQLWSCYQTTYLVHFHGLTLFMSLFTIDDAGCDVSGSMLPIRDRTSTTPSRRSRASK